MNFKKKIGNIFTSKFVGTGSSSYKKEIYLAAVSQRLRNTVLEDFKFSSTPLCEPQISHLRALLSLAVIYRMAQFSVVKLITQRIRGLPDIGVSGPGWLRLPCQVDGWPKSYHAPRYSQCKDILN